jgi:hypothetical protein
MKWPYIGQGALHRPSSLKSQTRRKIAEDPTHTIRDHLKSHYTICRPRLMKAKSFYWPGKDIIVFRFIIEYRSLMDFGPLGNNNNNRSICFIWGFLKDDILACVETWD